MLFFGEEFSMTLFGSQGDGPSAPVVQGPHLEVGFQVSGQSKALQMPGSLRRRVVFLVPCKQQLPAVSFWLTFMENLRKIMENLWKIYGNLWKIMENLWKIENLCCFSSWTMLKQQKIWFWHALAKCFHWKKKQQQQNPWLIMIRFPGWKANHHFFPTEKWRSYHIWELVLSSGKVPSCPGSRAHGPVAMTIIYRPSDLKWRSTLWLWLTVRHGIDGP